MVQSPTSEVKAEVKAEGKAEAKAEAKAESKYLQILRNATLSLSKKGFSEFQSILPEHMEPSALANNSAENKSLVPDLCAKRGGKPGFFEISQKTTETSDLITKWKVFVRLANSKDGMFQVLVPKGQMRFTRDLITQNKIDVELVQL